MPPPGLDHLENTIPAARRDAARHAVGAGGATRAYLPWDTFRFKTPPAGISHDEWWWVVRSARRAAARETPGLLDLSGRPLSFNLPDPLLRDLERITAEASGRISISEQVTNPGTRDRYVVSSLIEESIRSSQLEGAATTRQVAKEMIRSGRPPRDRSERMILNNYRAMTHIADLREERLTPELVAELHRIVTQGTLDRPESAGRLQAVDADRVQVWSDSGDLLHRPPPVAELPERLERLCAFANADDVTGYVPPVLRAVAVHFVLGHDHYFEDGNGRTARAAFYWSMLNQGFWLTEFLSISAVLKGAPARYATAFVLTEQDEGDLTHFFLHQSGVILRAVDQLRSYLASKAAELRSVRETARGAGNFNHRQLDLIEHAVRTPAAQYTVESHRRSHGVVVETARQDLIGLEQSGLLLRSRVARRFVWSPATDLADRLGRG